MAVLGVSALPSNAAAAHVRPGFVGVMADGPLFFSGVKLGHQVAKMAADGVGSVRVAFNWSKAQPYQDWNEIPAGQKKHFTHGPGGVPTSYFETDRIVRLAAIHHLTLLPVVTTVPPWDGSPKGQHNQPARDAPYGRYLTGLIRRYGPSGRFWSDHRRLPRRPLTAWQIWNEPELTENWDTFPFARSYVRLLRVAHDAIRRADPSARVVLAALTNYGWRDLASIYKVQGSRRVFDEVAANPYTAQPSGVITILGYFRKAMDDNGDSHKPLLATEVGWPSAKGKSSQDFGFNTTERGQAKKLSELLPLLAKNRHRLRLASFYYYTWMSTDPRHGVPFQYAGLLRFRRAKDKIDPKPAYFAFRRTVRKLER
ncbi:MAG: hypothetical protein ACJ764_05750 [Solirubrobacteraceae bacterium]